ncbi:acyl carrier protein [Streptomyces sp. NPDC047022]|uniref:acyl carrier protein n=1 Tax=Streptomyces sp. NPDC047022 TaxID=3155737 RepID=UPI00340D4976
MSERITVEELSELMKKAAGVTVAPQDLQQSCDSDFDSLGIDSLGLLGIVGELENRHGTQMPPDAERCKTPRQFLDLVNTTLMAGA